MVALPSQEFGPPEIPARFTPIACIDYVLVHELCHLDHPHHGQAFWQLLARRMPDWQARKERLERTLA